MNILYNRLPKDLVYIIEDYAKDRRKSDHLLDELLSKCKRYIVYYERKTNIRFSFIQWFTFTKRQDKIRKKEEIEKKKLEDLECIRRGRFDNFLNKNKTIYYGINKYQYSLK